MPPGLFGSKSFRMFTNRLVVIGYPNLTYLLIGQNFVNIMITELSERRIDLHPGKWGYAWSIQFLYLWPELVQRGLTATRAAPLRRFSASVPICCWGGGCRARLQPADWSQGASEMRGCDTNLDTLWTYRMYLFKYYVNREYDWNITLTGSTIQILR